MNSEFWQLPGRKGILAASRQEGYAKKGVRRGQGVPGGSPGHPKSVREAPGNLPRLEKAVPRGHRRQKSGEIPGKFAKLAGDRRESAGKSARGGSRGAKKAPGEGPGELFSSILGRFWEDFRGSSRFSASTRVFFAEHADIDKTPRGPSPN